MPYGNRLTDMDYDEVSLVDAGANNDDTEGAHVLLMKRDAKITEDEVVDFGTHIRKARPADGGSKSSGKSSKKKKGTSQRSQNWDESRHPRIKGGPGGGEFSSTSAASKTKYGKGGTAIDNLPKGYRTTNSAAERLGLEHGVTAAQARNLPKATSSSSGSGSTSAAGKAKKAAKAKLTAQKKAQSAQQKKLRQQVALINGLAANQRAAYRSSKKPVPAGYQWNSNDRLVNSGNLAAKNKLARSLGLPAAQTSSKKKSSSGSTKSTTKMQLTMDSSGHISWKPVSVPSTSTKTTTKTTPKKKASTKKRKGKVKKNSVLTSWLYGERSAAS